IRLLVTYFLKKFAQHQKQAPKSISPGALSALEQYAWPGNVRELENVIQRALVVAKGEVIVLTDLPPELVANRAMPPGSAPPSESLLTSTASTPAKPGPGNSGLDLPALVQGLFSWARQDSQRKLIAAV